MLDIARIALRDLDLCSSDFAIVENDPEESFESHANDRSFDIVRVQGHAARVITHGALRSLILLLEDAGDSGTELDAEHWGRLRNAFTVIIMRLAGTAPAADPIRVIAPCSPATARERDALRRWQRGHYAFMTIIQGLIMALHRFAESLESSDPAGMSDALVDAATIMWGSESALRFAGDFAYSAYEKAVRPTLMPPIAPPGMTGLHWRDHRFMISTLTKFRHWLPRIPRSLHRELDAFHDAMSAAYESHKYVCASFVGTEQPSLLMASRPKKTAIETLDHFKTIRLGLLDGPRQVATDDPDDPEPAPKKL